MRLSLSSSKILLKRPNRRAAVLASLLAIVVGIGIIPAYAADTSASMDLAMDKADSLIAHGEHFPDDAKVDIAAEIDGGSGQATFKTTTQGSFLVGFTLPSGFTGRVEITATSGDTEVSGAITVGDESTGDTPTTKAPSVTTTTKVKESNDTSTSTTKAPSTSMTNAPASSTGGKAIGVSGNQLTRGGQPWWFIGYNSFIMTGDCGSNEEKAAASPEAVDSFIKSMRNDGHGIIRIFFYEGWNKSRLNRIIATAKAQNVYLAITLEDGIKGCGSDGNLSESWVRDMATTYKGDSTIAFFEYYNEPTGEQFNNGLVDQITKYGAIIKSIDPTRLRGTGSQAPYWMGGEANQSKMNASSGVDVVSMHEYDENEAASNHTDESLATADGKPLFVGEFGIKADSGSFGSRANQFQKKVNAYAEMNGVAAIAAWSWQPGNGGSSSEYGNLDADTASQKVLREGSLG